jgi:hypothetical protein
VPNAELHVQSSCHTIWQRHADPVVRLSTWHRCGCHCRRARPRRCRNGGFHARRARRRIEVRHGVGSGIERSAQQQLLPPGIELPAADAVLASHHRHRHPRLHAFGHDLVLLLGRPTTAPAAGPHLGTQAPCARTISRTSIPHLRSALRHAVLFRHRQHLAPNRTRRAT